MSIKNFKIFSSLFYIVFIVTPLILIKAQETISSVDDGKVEDDVGDGGVGGGEKILSRQRRYLLFPAGSSLQMIFDQVITITKFNNLYITGQTAALAWELPSKPIYDDDLSDIYETGTLPLLQPVFEKKEEDKNISVPIIVEQKEELNKTIELTSPEYSYPPEYDHHADYLDSYYKEPIIYDRYYSDMGNIWTRPLTENKINDYRRRYFNAERRRIDQQHNYPRRRIHEYRYPNNIYSTNQYENQRYSNERFSNDKYLQMRYSSGHKQKSTSRNNNNYKKINSANLYYQSNRRKGKQLQFNRRKKQRIYPVFVKRSLDNYVDLSNEDKFFIDHHRSTRQVLYNLLEIYMNGKGRNGTECLLKTLCEVGQRQNENEPGTFTAEIIRAVFSLPMSNRKVENKKHQLYDEAHVNLHKNCTDIFPNCPESVYLSSFIH